MIITVLIILILIIVIITDVFGDLILIKTKLRRCNKYSAEIIYFTDKVKMNHKGGYDDFTVVKYYDAKEERKTFIYKDKRDKYGDRIEIVTNGELTARNGIVIPEGLGVLSIVKTLVFSLIGGPILYNIGDLYAVFGIGTVFLFFLLYLLIYPLAREACDEDIKRSLGWPYHK